MSHLKRKLYIDLSEKMEIIRYSIGICEGFLQTVAYMGQVVSASFVIVKDFSFLLPLAYPLDNSLIITVDKN